MTAFEFELLKTETDTKTDALLVRKASEYTADKGDKLHAFYKASGFTGETPKQVLGGYMLKHITSIYDMIKEDSKNYEKWDEKILDTMCYLYLLRALLQEEK